MGDAMSARIGFGMIIVRLRRMGLQLLHHTIGLHIIVAAFWRTPKRPNDRSVPVLLDS
jgi:hypothetical protein